MPDRLQASKAAPVAAQSLFIRLLTLLVERMFPQKVLRRPGYV
jgi:hypothetical protein